MGPNEESTAVQVMDGGALVAIDRAEIDMHIATAKKYPRNIPKAVKAMEAMIDFDPELAEQCFYCLDFYKDEDGKPAVGHSIRLAEMAASQWGNVRYGSRPLDYGDKTVTAQGYCYDLETNAYYTTVKTRSILKKSGQRYTEPNVVKAMLSAQAIAERDAVSKIIPRVYLNRLRERAMQSAVGNNAEEMKKKRDVLVKYFEKLGVSMAVLFAYLNILDEGEITKEHLIQLRGIANAIKDGHQSVDDVFFKRPDVETGTITPADLTPAVDQRVKNLTPEEAEAASLNALAIGMKLATPTPKPETKPTPPADTATQVQYLGAEVTDFRKHKGVTTRAWLTQWKKPQSDMTPEELVAAYDWLRAMPEREEEKKDEPQETT